MVRFGLRPSIRGKSMGYWIQRRWIMWCVVLVRRGGIMRWACVLVRVWRLVEGERFRSFIGTFGHSFSFSFSGCEGGRFGW